MRVVGHNGTATASIRSFLSPLFKDPPVPAASSSILLKSPALQSSGSPYGVPMASLNRTTGFGNGQRAAQDAGHSVDHSRETFNSLAPFSRPSTSPSRFSFPRASRISKQCLEDGAAKKAELVEYEKSLVKKAHNALPKKNNRNKVRFGSKPHVLPYEFKPGEKEFKIEGDKFPGLAHLSKWEVDRCRQEVKTVITELKKEEDERILKRKIEEAKHSEYIAILLMISDIYHSFFSEEEQKLVERELALERGFIRSMCYARVCQDVWTSSSRRSSIFSHARAQAHRPGRR